MLLSVPLTLSVLPYILGTMIDQTITVIFVDELQESFDTRLVFYCRSILSLLSIFDNIIIKASIRTWSVRIYFRHTLLQAYLAAVVNDHHDWYRWDKIT